MGRYNTRKKNHKKYNTRKLKLNTNIVNKTHVNKVPRKNFRLYNQTRRRYRGGLRLANPFNIFKRRQSRSSNLGNKPSNSEQFEVVDLENEARQRASKIYNDYNSREYVTGPYGQTLRGIRDKKQKACEEAKKSIIEDPQFGRSIWVMIENEFPCPLGLMPEEEAEKLGSIISPESWNEIIKIGKDRPRFREIFVKTFFTDLTHYHVRPKFIRNNYTDDEIRVMIMNNLLPFEKKYLNDNPKAIDAIIKTIQKLSNMLKYKINMAVLNFAKRYWRQSGSNYLRTKNYIINRFGETVWSTIKNELSVFMKKKEGYKPMPDFFRSPSPPAQAVEEFSVSDTEIDDTHVSEV
jgi:hypothetical protein